MALTPRFRVTWFCFAAAFSLSDASAQAIRPDGAPQSAGADAGLAAFDNHRFDEAFAIWTDRARTGDPRAEFGLGLLSDLGKGTPQDEEQALRWYSRAAAAQFVPAEFNVAVMYDSGIGAARDLAAAALWYAKAAAHDNERAQYNLGQLYEEGAGVPRNLSMAESWYKAAASHGLAEAREKLQDLHKALAEQRPSVSAALVAATAYAVAADPPVNGESLDLELGWTAPAQAFPVTYSIQIVGLNQSVPDIVFSSQSSRSAILARLPARAGQYAWRVYAIAPSINDYAAGQWGYFTIR